MKTIFTILMVTSCVTVFAQDKAFIKGDTLYYQDQKYYDGKQVQLSYGSSQDKGFAFVYISAGGMLPNAPSTIGKSTAVITGLKKYPSGKSCAIATLTEAKRKIVIDVEGAVDNGEIAKLNP